MIELLEHYFNVFIRMCWSHLFWPWHSPVVWKGASCCRISSLSQGEEMFGNELYFVMGLNLVVYLVISSSADWKALSPYIKCADFIFFYLEAIFFFSTFFHLLDEKCMSWRNFRKDWAVVPGICCSDDNSPRSESLARWVLGCRGSPSSCSLYNT